MWIEAINLQSDSSVPLSLGSPSNVVTLGPQSTSAWLMRASTSAGTARRSPGTPAAGGHSSEGPTQTPRFAGDIRLVEDLLAINTREHTTYRRSNLLIGGSSSIIL